MKISAINVYTQLAKKAVSFKGEDEYVNVPLVWETPQRDTFQNSQQTNQTSNKPNKLSRLGTKIATGTGVVTIIPSTVEAACNKVADAIQTVKTSYERSVDNIQEMRDYTKQKFHNAEQQEGTRVVEESTEAIVSSNNNENHTGVEKSSTEGLGHHNRVDDSDDLTVGSDSHSTNDVDIDDEIVVSDPDRTLFED